MNQRSTFQEMPLSDGMKLTIGNIGFDSPTPIQQNAIPELLLGKDVLGQAQTGTGKTAAFGIPVVELVNEQERTIQALIVCPTRELCLQVQKEIERLSDHKHGLESIAIYGGQSIDQQFKSLKMDRPQIVVATPGRLFDHLRRGSMVLSQVKLIVLDEADEMLDMGFRPEIEQIFELLPEENQRIFFSATMAKQIKDLACTYLRDPKIIKTESKALTVNTIKQSYIKIRGREKTELLCRMLDLKDPKLAVIFCNAKSTADEVADEIHERGFAVGVLHGDLSQNQRDRVMAKFRSGMVRVLVATDVAARGLDIDDVELVLNFHLPHDPEDYVHRIGRTGRAGKVGCAVSLVEPRDNTRLRRISQFARIDIVEERPPTRAEVKSAKLRNILLQASSALSSVNIQEYRSAIAKQNMSAEDVAAGMLQLALKKFDERSNDDTAFEELRDRKYSGFSGERGGRRDRDDGPRGRDRDRDRGPKRAGGFDRFRKRDDGDRKGRFGDRETKRSFGDKPAANFNGRRNDRDGRSDTRNGAGDKAFSERPSFSRDRDNRDRPSFARKPDRAAKGARPARENDASREHSFDKPKKPRSSGGFGDRPFGGNAKNGKSPKRDSGVKDQPKERFFERKKKSRQS